MNNKETMTSRQRLIKTLNHEIPDRVPIDLGGFQTGIHKRAYAELLSHLGLKEEITILDPVQQLAFAVLERLAHHGAVQIEIDAVDGARALLHLVQQFAELFLIHGGY